MAPIAIIFLIVFGGIYGGLFTPTEGAAVGAAATFVAALLRGEMTWRKFKHCFYATAEGSAMIFMIFIGADLMNSALALTQVPNQLAAVVRQLGPRRRWRWWRPILLFYVVLGAVMDELSMILLTIPIFFPMIMGLDFGMPKESVAIWFGIMVLMTVGFGLLAPPVGLNVYIVNGMAKDVPIGESYRGVMPFLISDTLRTLLLLFFPGDLPLAGEVHRLRPESAPLGSPTPAGPLCIKLSDLHGEPTHDPASYPFEVLGRRRPGGARPERPRPAGRHAQVPHLHGAAVQRLADHAQAVDGKGREGIGRPHQVRGAIPPCSWAARRCSCTTRPRTAWSTSSGRCPATRPGRFPRIEVFELPFMMNNAEATSKAYWEYVQTMAPDEFKDTQVLALHVHGPGMFHTKDKLIKTRGRPEGHEGARPDPPDHQDAGLPRRHAGRHAAAGHSRRAVQGHHRRLRDPVGSGALGQGARADQVPQRVRPRRRRAVHHHLRDGA